MRWRVCVVVMGLAACAGAGLEFFSNRTAPSGIGFKLLNGATAERRLIETMAGGVAAADFDGDGLVDVYFANGAPQPSLEKPSAEWHNRLYRNRGNWRFEDVTAKAGVAGSGFHFGVGAADFDNDGDMDLFVAGMPRSHLFRNRGDGVFEDVTAKAGVQNRQQWPVAAGWFDFDSDGFLDLFVVNYVRWNPASEPFCGDGAKKYRTYCHPKHYPGTPNTLFRNNGDGSFTDVTDGSGIGRSVGKGMGLAFGDYDGDGRLDVFVSNDTVPNFLFRNEGGGKFKEVGLQAGVAFNDDGRALSSMGVDLRDLDNDGREDAFITALSNETFPLYRNLGNGLFLDATYASQIGAATLPFSGWGAGAFDFDNDGWKDLFTANGDVNDNTELYSSRKSRQRNLLLRNQRNGTFAAVEIGEAALHRGAAFADFDADGGIDAVVTALNAAPTLLRNEMPRGRWIGFRLQGTRSNREGIGARIQVTTNAGSQWNRMVTSVGYASSSEPLVHFGLGQAAEVTAVEIRWPAGGVQKIEKPEVGRYHTIREP